MFENVLVLLDGSTDAEVVIPYSVQISTAFGAELHAVVVSDEKGAVADRAFSTYAQKIAGEISVLLHQWQAQGKGSLHTETLLGKRPEQIIEYIEQHIAPLVLMGCPTCKSKPSLMNTLADMLLKSTTKPSMVVKTAPDQEALKQKQLIKRVLLPLDGSYVGEAALPYGEALAEIFKAEIVLFRVVESAVTWSGTEGQNINWAESRLEQDKKSAAEAEADMARILSKLQSKGLSASAIVKPPADPTKEIVRYAMENAIDLIAMSSHGRSGIKKYVLGSVAQGVLKDAEKPVLIVRAATP